MRVVVAGIYRSASTWLYNAVRLSLAEVDTTYGSYVSDYRIGNKSKHHVIKTIRYNTDVLGYADVVVTSYRNINDIIDSMKRRREINTDDRFTNETHYESINTYLLYLLWWQQHAKYMMYYEDFIRNKRGELLKIHRALGISPNVDTVLAKLDAIKIPEIGFDPVTLYHADHITK